MWIKGKEYFNVNKWASIFNRDYGDKGIKVSPRDIHTLFQHFKIPMTKDPYNQAINLYPVDMVTRYRQMERSKEFLSALYNLSQYGDINGFAEPSNDDSTLSYKNNENDMDSYSDYLINQKYQFESRKKIKISENIFKKLFEDVYMTNADSVKKKVQLKYAKNGGKYNKGNESSLDMIKTDKMDKNDNDTYEVPLKGGIMSYNITSINGTEVMHYFKRIFDKQKTYAKLSKYGNEEYELEMADSEFKSFMEQFVTKVSKVVGYKINEFNSSGANISGISIYPVPSSSRFNSEMAKRMQFNLMCGFTPKLIDQSLLRKDLSKLEKDNEFIGKNSQYYNERYSNQMPKDITHMNYVDREYNRFSAITNAQNNISEANKIAKQLIQKYYSRKEVNTPKFYEKLNLLFTSYMEAVNNIVNTANYFDTVSKKKSSVHLAKIAKAIKYSKGPSIEERTNEIYDMLKSQGYLKNIPRTKLTQVCYWEPVNFQIKNLSNDVRMTLKNYFQPNDNKDIVDNELNNTENNVFVIFDDNISGGATLSDICNQLKNLGIKYIVPITFGKMRESWNSRTIVVNKPKNWEL